MQKTVEKMSVKEKIAFCSGADYWHTKAMPQYGLEPIMMADGPHGLRKQESSTDALGINRSAPATCFPAEVSTACSWDPELQTQIGQAIAREAVANGVSVVLGPGANIKRNPLCGRNFEYFSEDPYLTGKLAAGFIRGVEGTGAGSSVKHFACNSQEFKRFSSDSIADERTLREIYLAGFEMAIREGKPSTVMCAYNKLNGIHCSDHHWLLTQVLREQWGFEGLVVTDWGAMHSRIESFRAGCDLNMPGGSAYMEPEACSAVRNGTLDACAVDRSAQRVEKLVRQGKQAVRQAVPADMEAHYCLAKKAAVESAVLLKNQENLLPLDRSKKLVLIGPMAQKPRYQGSGSSHINPWKLRSVCDACPQVPFVPGCTEDGETNELSLAAAEAAARDAEVAVVFAGLTDKYESEGFDRENMQMPQGYNRLIQTIARVNPRTVVVLFGGSPMELPWLEDVSALLYMGLPGEAGADAIAQLLFGETVPCGKLAESWPYRYSDCVSAGFYANGKKDAHYREGVYVGYRYYTSAKVPVRFPFGFGLSYTSFSYNGLQINGDTVRCTVTNTGTVTAGEIVQLYIAPPAGELYRPALELKGFQKVFLNPGESRAVTFFLDERSFAVWNDGWVIPGGTYRILVGSSSEHLPLEGTVTKPEIALKVPRISTWYHTLAGAPTHNDFEQLVQHPVVERPIQKGEFTMENTVMEMKDHSALMRLLFWGVELYISSGFGWKKDYTNPTFRMMINSAAGASLSGMRISGRLRRHWLEGALEIANGHFWKGICTFFKRSS